MTTNINNRFFAISNIIVLVLILLFIIKNFVSNKSINLYAVYLIIIWILKGIPEKISKYIGMKYKDRCDETDNSITGKMYCLFKNYWPRPEEAKGCGFIDPIFNPDKPSTGGGMPSGHSAHFGLYGTIILLNLIELKINPVNNIHSSIVAMILVVMVMIMVPISRIDINCHTSQQVMIGFSLGVIQGLIFYALERLYLRKFERFSNDREEFYKIFLY